MGRSRYAYSSVVQHINTRVTLRVSGSMVTSMSAAVAGGQIICYLFEMC